VHERWATFDCYGTLVDWNGGIRAELERLFGSEQVDGQLHRYHELEPELEADGSRSYREVLTEAMRRLGAPAGSEHGLAESLPAWPAFPEVHDELMLLRSHGWRLGILSNTDPDLIAASQVQIGVPFDEVVVAGEIGSYKPAHRHWEEFLRRSGARRDRHVHAGASLFHDIAPANELGVRSIWINRLGEESRDGARPDRELPDLRGLSGALEELAPGR
jgi:2-haloacid dehalogenase